MKFRAWVLAALPLVLLGCASDLQSIIDEANQLAAEEGSPFRWQREVVDGGVAFRKVLVGIPAPTAADPVLEEFTRQQISTVDATDPIEPESQPVEIRLLSASEMHVQEVWIRIRSRVPTRCGRRHRRVREGTMAVEGLRQAQCTPVPDSSRYSRTC